MDDSQAVAEAVGFRSGNPQSRIRLRRTIDTDHNSGAREHRPAGNHRNGAPAHCRDLEADGAEPLPVAARVFVGAHHHQGGLGRQFTQHGRRLTHPHQRMHG